MDDKTQKLYQTLYDKGLYTKTFDDFTTQFSDEVKKEKLFNSLNQKGLYTKTYDEFNSQFFPVKKKDYTKSILGGETPLEAYGLKQKESTTPKLPYQSPKVEYDETLPENITPTSVIKSNASKGKYLEQKQTELSDKLSSDFEKEAKKLKSDYEKKLSQEGANKKQLEEEYKVRLDDLKLRKEKEASNEWDKMLDSDNYEFLAPEDVKGLGKEIDKVVSQSIPYDNKQEALDAIRDNFLTKTSILPADIQNTLKREINEVFAKKTLFDEKGNITNYGWKKEAEQKLNQVQGAKNRILSDFQKKYPDFYEQVTPTPSGGVVQGFSPSADADPTKRQQFYADYIQYKKDRGLIGKAEEKLGNIMQTNEESASFADAFRLGGRDLLASVSSAGWSDVAKALETAQLATKVQQGEKLSEGEQALFDTYGIFDAYQQGLDGSGFKLGNTLAQSIPMIESIASLNMIGVLGGAGTATLKQIAKKEGIKKLLTKEGAKLIGKEALNLGGAMAKGAPLTPQSWVRQQQGLAGQKVLNEKGEWAIDKATVEGKVEATLKGLATGGTELGSEILGGYMGEFGQVLKKIPGIKNIKLPKVVGQMAKTAGVQGAPTEITEEFINMLWQAPIGDQPLSEISLQDIWDTVWTTAGLTTILGSAAIPGGIMNTVQRNRNYDVIKTFGKDAVAQVRDAIAEKDMGKLGDAIKSAFEGKTTESLGMDVETAQRRLLSYAKSVATEVVAKDNMPTTTDKDTVATEVGALEVPQEVADQKAQEELTKEQQLQAIEDLKAAEKTDEPVGTITKLETKDGRDNYNVVNEEGQRDTFSVPEGSPQEVVQAKSEELVKPKETKDTQSIIRESSIDELRNLPENIDGDRGNKAFNIFDKIDWSSRESILEGLSAISEIINGKWVPKERLVEYLNTAKKIIGSDNIWSKDFIGRWIAVRTKDFSKVQSASETKVAIKDIVEPTTTNPVFKGTISTPSGEGHFSAQIHEDGTAHLMDIQIGYDKNAPRGKGYGKNAYIEIGNELAKRGYVLESTRWEKHNTAISPQSLAIWAKLEKEGLAKKTGTSESKIYNRETGEETIQNIPTYEFVKPTETGGQTDAQRSGTENQKVIEQVTPELVGQESDTGGVRNNEQVEPIEEEVTQEYVQKPAEFTELEQAPKVEQTESKEAISATQETGGGKISQTKEKSVETAEKAPKEGSAQMTLGIRALNSPKLDQDIKDGIAEKGINYEPRGRQVRADEAKEIVDLFGQEEGGLDKIEAMVYNTKNDIPNDTRTFLNVYLADAYNNLKNKSIDSAEKDRLRRKVIDLYMFGMEQGKLGGQHVEAQKEWGKVFGSSPEMVSALVRNHIERKNQQFFKNKEEEIAAAKKLLDDVFASPEGKARMEQEVSDEISKIGTKNFGKESKQKIDDFFSKLLIDPKQQNLYGGFLGIPVAAWNGSVLAVKNAVLLGVDLATAIQRGAEYLDKWYKDEYAKGKIASPDWNKAEYESHMRDKLSGLKKEVPTTDKKKATKKEPKPKTPPTQEEVVNKLLEKMAGFATKKQLQNFIKDYIQELQEKGVVDDKRFKDLLSKALGLDYVSDKTEAQLTASAQTLGHAQRKIQEVIDLFNQLESVEPGSREFADLRKKLNEAKKEAEKASFNAQKANQYIKTLLTDEPELLDKVGTLIQGNLLVPTSIIRNLYGNVFMAPARATRFMVMNTADAFLSKVGIARDLMKDPTSSLYINPVKNPELYKWAMKLPTTERTVDMMASFRGYREGVWQGLKEGARQLKTGQLEDDYRKKEIQRGLQPIEALLRLRDSLTGREKRSFDKMVGDLLEALPAGYMGEGMFRLLNLGDKPFRRAAETARLSEIAELKGLKDLQREKFLNNPDNASLEEARKAGDFAVYTNDNAVSKMIDYLNTTFKKGQKSNSDAIKSTSAIAKALFKLGKATTLPYVRTPVNLAVEAFEYAVPTYSLARALESTAKGKRREALDYFGKATVGAIISSVAVALIKSGIMTPAGSDEDKLEQAEFTGKEGYRMNIDAFHRWINGGDPTWQDGDETVTLKGYGTMSMIMMAYGAAYKGKTAEEIEAESNPERWATVFGSVVTSSLEQSIMTGVNTALQAALKGEKERDRWLINTANALSTAVYPNTVASISKTFADENYIRETRDLSKEDGRLKAQMVNTFKDRLFMGKDLPTKVSIWGEPVKMIPDGDNWTYMLLGVTKNKKYQKYSFGVKMYELYEEFKKNNPDEAKNIFPSLPTANSKVGWDDSKMTPHELQNYQMRVGELRAEYAENYVNSEEWKNATIDDRVQKLTSMYSKARKVADSEMFRWSGFEGRDPKRWKILSDNDAVPIPSNTKKIKQGQKEWQLEPAEVEILNNIALDRYATLVIPFIEANKDNMATLNKPNEKTGKIPYVERINDKWRMALEYAKREMIRQKVQEQK